MIKTLFLLLIMKKTTLLQDKPLMIAHAGGGINHQNYSNSIEALDHNYANGFRYFEIDFSWTSDDQLVCLHDWQKRFKKVFGSKTKEALSYLEFNQLLDSTTGLHPCTLESLAEWIKTHKDVKIITDVKFRNLKAIKLIKQKHPQISKNLIPQFYQPEEYKVLEELGFKQLIWILYQYQGSYESVVEHSKNMQLIAISMRASQAKKKFVKQLLNNNHHVFVYTINDKKTLDKLVNQYQVSGIYTDFLEYQ
jgi:glycerophosphoryl diester phosphodiesterase